MNSEFAFSVDNVFTDHMVFQRDKPIRIAGSAPRGFPVTVHFAECAATVKAGADNRWLATFPPRAAQRGVSVRVECPPFAKAIELRDVAVGELWFCGGQSNMEFPVKGERFYSLTDGDAVAAAANDPDLRVLYIPHAVAPDGPCHNATPGIRWETCDTPDFATHCSAIGYLFGQMLRKRLGVPVGLVSSNWGGCRIEPWISEDALRRFRLTDELRRLETARRLDPAEDHRLGKAEQAARKRVFRAWLRKFQTIDPAKSREALASWAKPDAPKAGWGLTYIAQMLGCAEPGIVWYRRTVTIPADWKGGVRFHADWINDLGEIFWDGRRIGASDCFEESYWSLPRNFDVPLALSRPGEHTVAVRIQNHYGAGSMAGVRLETPDGSRRLELSGQQDIWFERIELRPPKDFPVRPVPPCMTPASPRLDSNLPSTQFNAMFAPVATLAMRGAIWYQGCSNAGEWKRYGLQQKALVDGWRRAVGDKDFAFVAVELAGFAQHNPGARLADDFWKDLPPMEQPFSLVREAQETIRSVRRCGIASAVDIGDHSDIHPANKREVARGLEAVAATICYGSKALAEGPRLDKVIREGGKLRLTFTNVGKGLCLKGGKAFGPHAFAIAGRTGAFVWAEAKLVGDEVLVWSPDVPEPAHVRYAFSSFPPSMRLFNKNGFPATPFRK